MDIRDINEAIIYPGKSSFQDIFELQKLILKEYVGIEGLPQWPIDMNIKSSQILMKDFMGRVIEELGEGYESYEIMLNMFHKGHQDYELVPHLQNFNEEISDALHFWLEVMIYSGFETGTLFRWLNEISFGIKPDCDLLESWLSIGELSINLELPFNLPSRCIIKDSELDDEFLRGGRRLSKDISNTMKQYLWDITYNLQIARNTLKNKPWKQSQMMTDLNNYEGWLKKATISLFKFLSFTGFTKESIYVIYYKKNKVNQFRIKSKY